MSTWAVTFKSKNVKSAKNADVPATRTVMLAAASKAEAVKMAQRSEMRFSNRVLRDAHQQLTAHAIEVGVDVMELDDPTSLDELKKAVSKEKGHDKAVLTNTELNEQRADMGDWELVGAEEIG